MDKSQSFEGLLSEAPLGADEGMLKLVGALHRSHQQGKFMLSFGLGQSVTLEIDAVRDYKVLASTVSQTIVEIEVPRELIPKEIREEMSRHLTAAFSDTPDELDIRLAEGSRAEDTSEAVPFALLTGHQASDRVISARTPRRR